MDEKSQLGRTLNLIRRYPLEFAVLVLAVVLLSLAGFSALAGV